MDTLVKTFSVKAILIGVILCIAFSPILIAAPSNAESPDAESSTSKSESISNGYGLTEEESDSDYSFIKKHSTWSDNLFKFLPPIIISGIILILVFKTEYEKTSDKLRAILGAVGIAVFFCVISYFIPTFRLIKLNVLIITFLELISLFLFDKLLANKD